jgi:SAM-dependent methyltransferase
VDYQALYAHRFKNIDQVSRNNVWKVVSQYVYKIANSPERVLDPACGIGEFINYCPAQEKWAADFGMDGSSLFGDIKFFSGSFLTLELPDNYFNLIYLSNVLEHLDSQYAVNEFLLKAKEKLSVGGRLVIMGPNFKYCSDEYFDCADHTTILTHISMEEHLVTAGFQVELNVGRFIPYSFRSRLPAYGFTTKIYLKLRFIWPLLGKQFLLVGVKK